jgi:hypothetical protein
MKNIMSYFLEKDQIAEMAVTFQDAYVHVLSLLTQTPRDLALRFTAELTMQYLPWTMVTKEGKDIIQSAVFGREENRDFILLLTHVFFARQGGDEEFINALCKTLARSISVPSRPAKSMLMPEDIHTRLAKLEETIELLKTDLWVVTILLLQLFITPRALEEAKS